jgi:cell division protein FtsZ
VIFGAVIDDALRDEVRVTVIATGFGAQRRRRRIEAPEPTTPNGGPTQDEPRERSDVELEIPSFLRDD